jgi:hypothetical protein
MATPGNPRPTGVPMRVIATRNHERGAARLLTPQGSDRSRSRDRGTARSLAGDHRHGWRSQSSDRATGPRQAWRCAGALSAGHVRQECKEGFDPSRQESNPATDRDDSGRAWSPLMTRHHQRRPPDRHPLDRRGRLHPPKRLRTLPCLRRHRPADRDCGCRPGTLEQAVSAGFSPSPRGRGWGAGRLFGGTTDEATPAQPPPPNPLPRGEGEN